MNPNHQYRARIPPIVDGLKRPLWSVMIPTYNCAKYLQSTLRSVMSQDLGPEKMQIEVIDDNSVTDNPEMVVDKVGKGRVNFYRQSVNVGHTRNFETCLQRSRGKLIHLLHGDDCVRDGFYNAMEHAFTRRPEIGAAFCRHIFMNESDNWMFISPLLQNESGILNDWLQRYIVKQYIQTPSMVVKREAYEKLGGFDHRLKFYEDWEMWLRIATEYPIWYEVQPLALYRMHASSNTGGLRATGEDIQDVRQGLEIAKSYLSKYLTDSTVRQLIALNLEHTAICALEHSRSMLRSGNVNSGITQIREALLCSQSPKVLFRLAKVLMPFN